jgi:hypothetical protein
MTKLKLGFAAGVAALVAFGVAACGPQAEKPADTAAPAAVTEPAPAPVADPAAAPAPAVDPAAPAAPAAAPAAPAAPAEAPKKP